jgi:hypothetical protein
MKLATQDSGERTMRSGLMLAGTQSEAAGGATAPTQHAAQALQYELLAVDSESELAEVSGATSSSVTCAGMAL